MAEKIAELVSGVTAFYGRFTILDDDGLAEQPPGTTSIADIKKSKDRWFQAGYNGAHVDGTFRDYWPDVTMQLWDGAPPAINGWDREASVKVYLSSGKVYLDNVLGEGDPDAILDLRKPASTWMVRCYAKQTEPEEEEFLLQFWLTS